MKKEIPCRVQTAWQGIFIGKRNPENNWREGKMELYSRRNVSRETMEENADKIGENHRF